MTDETLAELLAQTLMNAPPSEKTNAYVMFGIKYAEQLYNAARVRQVVTLCREMWPQAGASASAHTDIGYGIRLARYVEFQQGRPPRWLA